jgi:hypothetical protein
VAGNTDWYTVIYANETVYVHSSLAIQGQ